MRLFRFDLDTSEFLWQAVGAGASVFLFEIDLHALEAELVGGDNIVDDNPLRHVPKELGGIELVVGSGGGNDLGLFLDGKVLVGVGGINVLGVQIKNLVVRDDTGVGEVVDAGQSLLGHGHRGGEHLRQNGHGVGDVDDAFVFDNLGDETAVDEVVGDGHANPQNQAVGIHLEHGFHVSLGFAVEGPVKVWLVLLGESNAGSLRVFLVVHKDATGGVDGAVDVAFQTQIGKVEGSNDVGTDSFRLVGFAPINVGAAGNPGGVQYVRRLVLIEFLGDGFTVLNSGFGGLDLDSVLFGHLDHEASDPSGPSSEDEDFLHFFAFIGCHFDGFEFLS
jgi:hypothetical protein